MAFDLHHGSATDQQHSSEIQNQQQQQQQPSFSLPPYPQMIMEAIEYLNDKNGSNKTTISKHIESTQQTLPPSHATLLSYHLNQMKKSGQLLLVKNNYMKPDSDAPPKRGRGRPPKQKAQTESLPAAAATTVTTDPPRSRGRPPKPKDPSEASNQPPKEKIANGSGRPRGRPPKKPRTNSGTDSAAPEPVAAQSTSERRGRGRPPKVKTTVVAPVGC